MRFDIDEQHFTVFNLLILLLVWANTCYLLMIVGSALKILPLLIAIILFLTAIILTLSMVVITIWISIKWVRHHNLGWKLLIAILILIVISLSIEFTVKQIFIREQFHRQEYLR